MSHALAMSTWGWIGIACVAGPLLVIMGALLWDKQRGPKDPPAS